MSANPDRMIEFLRLVPSARWRHVPKPWRIEFRDALSERYVKIGWGGVLELTDAGKARSAGQSVRADADKP